MIGSAKACEEPEEVKVCARASERGKRERERGRRTHSHLVLPPLGHAARARTSPAAPRTGRSSSTARDPARSTATARASCGCRGGGRLGDGEAVVVVGEEGRLAVGVVAVPGAWVPGSTRRVERLVAVVLLLLLLSLEGVGVGGELSALLGEHEAVLVGHLGVVDGVGVGAEPPQVGGERVVDALEAGVDEVEVGAVVGEVGEGVCEVGELGREVGERVLCARWGARRRVRQRVGPERGRREAAERGGRARRAREGRGPGARGHASGGASAQLVRVCGSRRESEGDRESRGATRRRRRKLGDEAAVSPRSVGAPSGAR